MLSIFYVAVVSGWHEDDSGIVPVLFAVVVVVVILVWWRWKCVGGGNGDSRGAMM